MDETGWAVCVLALCLLVLSFRVAFMAGLIAAVARISRRGFKRIIEVKRAKQM